MIDMPLLLYTWLLHLVCMHACSKKRKETKKKFFELKSKGYRYFIKEKRQVRNGV